MLLLLFPFVAPLQTIFFYFLEAKKHILIAQRIPLYTRNYHNHKIRDLVKSLKTIFAFRA